MARMTMELPPHVDIALQDIAQQEQISKAMVIRRALTYYARLLSAVRSDGLVVCLCTREGTVVREIVLDL